MEPTRRSFSTLPIFLITVLLWCIAYGAMKFFLKDLTVGPLQEDPAVLLQKVVGYLSFGAAIAYAVGGSIASMFPKRIIICLTAIFSIATLLVENTWGLSSPAFLAGTSISMGLFYGLFAVTRSVISCNEIVKTKCRDTTINGLVMILLISGLISGAYINARAYELIGSQAIWLFVGMFLVIGVLSLFLKYKQFEKPVPFRTSLLKTYREVFWIGRVRYMVLLPSASLWSISTIVSVKSIPYAVATFGIPESQSSLILLYSAIGVIIGNALTMKVKNRWLFFRIFTYIFAGLVALFPVLTSSFSLMVVYSISVGVFMGASTNLIDSYYLHFIGSNGVKENGAALNGVVLNALMAFLLFILQFIPEFIHFYVLGALAVGMGIFVRLKIKELNYVESVPSNIGVRSSP